MLTQLNARRFASQLVICACLALMPGCIPLPATRQFQPDSKPRPERAIGEDKKSPVQLGQTKIADAYIEVSKRLGPVTGIDAVSIWGPIGNRRPESLTLSYRRWRVSSDRRQFSVQFSIRERSWIAPLVFSAIIETRERWLTLEVDPAGTVASTRTTEAPPIEMANLPSDWLTIFDSRTRKRLREAGVFATDDELRKPSDFMNSPRAMTKPTPQPTATSMVDESPPPRSIYPRRQAR